MRQVTRSTNLVACFFLDIRARSASLGGTLIAINAH